MELGLLELIFGVTFSASFLLLIEISPPMIKLIPSLYISILVNGTDIILTPISPVRASAFCWLIPYFLVLIFVLVLVPTPAALQDPDSVISCDLVSMYIFRPSSHDNSESFRPAAFPSSLESSLVHEPVGRGGELVRVWLALDCFFFLPFRVSLFFFFAAVSVVTLVS